MSKLAAYHQAIAAKRVAFEDHGMADVPALNGKLAREAADERHICPLQLDLIERAIRLWSNEGDTVFSPFMGIGSEGWVALRAGRRFIGSELKAAYFKQAVKHLQEAQASEGSLFDGERAA